MLASCETVTIENQETAADLTAQLNVSEKLQTPNAAFDTSTKGIYHGVIASKNTQSRGKIWINLGNNTAYTALVEMQDGSIINFTGVNSSTFNETTSYLFTGKKGSFTVAANSANNPEISDVTFLGSPDYAIYVIKSTSANRASAYTGTFNETGNTAFSGTWNILSNGAYNPNQNGGYAISDLFVTFGNAEFTDTTFETGDIPCAMNAMYVPIVDIFDNPGEGIIAFDQVTNLNGTANWELYNSKYFYNNGTPTYYDGSCNETTSGNFSWAGPNGIRVGEIYVD